MSSADCVTGHARGVRKKKEAMVFHAKKWGWKRIAARLLLIPVLTGASAAVAPAQFNPVPPQAGSAKLPAAAPGNAKAMLKEGRKALAAGQLDRAQDLARAADANNPSGKWGLFDDTPNALLKDIQTAFARAKKNESEQLVKQAKLLLIRPAQGGEAERAAQLDQALHLAQRAEQLHGPYTAWEFGDRADKLAKEIQSARGRLKGVPPANAMAATTPPTGGSAGIPSKPPRQTPAFLPAGATMTAQPAANDPRKAVAVQLLAEGRHLAERNQFAAARAKFQEADRQKATFSANEDNPGFALQELNARGIQHIETHVAESRKMMAKKDYESAEANLTAGAEIAAALGLFARPVEDARAQLRAESRGKFGGPAPAAATDPVAAAPVKPIGGFTRPGEKTVVPADVGVSGRQLLDQAAFEFKRGELDMATKLAEQAFNRGGVKTEATQLLNTIDAERLAEKKITAVKSYDAAQSAMKNRDFNHALDVLIFIDPRLLTDDMKKKRR